MSDAAKPATSAANPPLDARDLQVVYANYCRVSATPEEVILDFGVHSRIRTDDGPEPVQLTHRLILTWPTTQRTAETLVALLHVHQTDPSHRRPVGRPTPPETPS